MTVAIIGGAGFVGLNVAEACLAAGRDVTLVDRAPPPDAAQAALAGLPGRLTVTLADVTDPASIADAIRPGTEVVVYGAALTAGPDREADEPERILAVNLGGLVPALRAAKAAGSRRVVLLSSVAALGETAFRDTPVDEDAPADPTVLYGITKLSSERVGARLGALWGVDVRAVRLSGVYGPWERDTGVRDTLSAHLQILQAASAGRPALLPRAGSRDWVYAPDVGTAVLALADAVRPAHALYNVSSGETSSVLAWGRALAALRPGFVCRLAEPGEAPTIDLHSARDRAPLSTERIAADLGWRAAWTAARSVPHLDGWWRRHGGGGDAA